MSDHLIITVTGTSHCLGVHPKFIFIHFNWIFIVMDELDEVIRTWNTHQIRPRQDQGMHGGRSILMFCIPQIYEAAEDKLRPFLPEEVAVCKEECTPKGHYPCDETVFELYVLFLDENGWTAPLDA